MIPALARPASNPNSLRLSHRRVDVYDRQASGSAPPSLGPVVDAKKSLEQASMMPTQGGR